jgi:ubiquinol-cytochrome c reductase cytochrome b subunit
MRKSLGSLKKLYEIVDDRGGISNLLDPLLNHLVPRGSTWLYVFGSATLFTFILQVVTGISLALMYAPSTESAYASLQYITNQAAFGNWLRGIHYWGASAMILLVGVHAIRVFLMASYKFPRELNWLTGVILLLLTVVMGFTGQLLRWDQDGFWTVFVVAEQAGRTPFIGKALAHFLIGGETVGATTLGRFFSYHVFWVPALLFGLIGFHIYMVLHNGISEPPKAGQVVDPKTYRDWYEKLLQREGVPFWPFSAWRDAVFSAIVILIVAALALIFGPPALIGPPDPTVIQALPRPDWYLYWLFAMLALIPPGIENYFIIGFPAIGVLLLLAVPFISNKGERSLSRRPWAPVLALTLVLMVGSLWAAGIKAPWSPDFSAKPLPASVVNSTDPAVVNGAALFHQKGCEYCHNIDGFGGQRGPALTNVGSLLTRDEMIARIMNGGVNMPAFGSNITPAELNDILAFLETRKNPNLTR